MGVSYTNVVMACLERKAVGGKALCLLWGNFFFSESTGEICLSHTAAVSRRGWLENSRKFRGEAVFIRVFLATKYCFVAVVIFLID